MPVFTIYTNVSKDKIPANFLKKTSELLASILSKPEGYCVVHVMSGQEHIAFGGSTAPCGYSTLMSIGQLGPDKNKSHAAALTKHVHESLGIPGDRFYIQFIDAKASDIALNGSTFA